MASGVTPDPSGNLADEVASEHRIRAFVLTGLREHLKTYGTELGPLLDEAGLYADAIKDDYAWIPLKKFANVLTFAARDTGDPCLGLKYGAAARFTSNPLGYLIANAPDLRTAFRSFARFHTVLNSNSLRFVETPPAEAASNGLIRSVCPTRSSSPISRSCALSHGFRRLPLSLGGRSPSPWCTARLPMLASMSAGLDPGSPSISPRTPSPLPLRRYRSPPLAPTLSCSSWSCASARISSTGNGTSSIRSTASARP